MHFLPEYLLGIGLSYAACLLAIASPGPNILAVMGTSMSVGRKAGMALAIGVAMGSLSWGLLTVLGLAALLSSYAFMLIGLKIIGGLYLLWLAFGAFKSSVSSPDIRSKAMSCEYQTPRGNAIRGYTVNMTNPKAALSWVAIIALGLPPEAPLWVVLVIVLGCSGLSIAVHLTYALMLSATVMSSLYLRARRGLQATLGAFSPLAGLKLLFSRP